MDFLRKHCVISQCFPEGIRLESSLFFFWWMDSGSRQCLLKNIKTHVPVFQCSGKETPQIHVSLWGWHILPYTKSVLWLRSCSRKSSWVNLSSTDPNGNLNLKGKWCHLRLHFQKLLATEIVFDFVEVLAVAAAAGMAAAMAAAPRAVGMAGMAGTVATRGAGPTTGASLGGDGARVGLPGWTWHEHMGW